ncbi:uncharacterized protein LOC118409107 [Branchiostoma floridae]|uniref:Uncharacterized protein LOC118409107 n=1 Tax=Branchiostoma floridae TaxID=7739 RepID=A0A9J7HWA8_BRAFL|nr:uncharacterized protein LOC118409107 [Branchiostoma floridae]
MTYVRTFYDSRDIGTVFQLQGSVSGEEEEDLQQICTPADAVNLTELEPSDGVLGVTCCVPPEKLDAVETTVTKRVKQRIAELSQRSGENGTCIRLEETPIVVLSGDELDAVIDVVVLAVNRGLDPRSTQENNSPPKWSFSGACSFSLTVVTTIGYGNLAPYTPGGQAFCVMYGAFGIPLTAVLLAKVAQGLSGLAVRIADRIRRSRPQWNPKGIRDVVRAFFVTLGLAVFLILPALTVSLVEGWNFLKSLYFMFVSLSTIGFGDYVAASQRDVNYSAAYQIVISAWILCGLAFLALVFDLITGGIEKVSGKVESKEADKVETTAEEGDNNVRGEVFTADVCKETKQRSENAGEASRREEDLEDNGIDEIILKSASVVDRKKYPKGKDGVKPGYSAQLNFGSVFHLLEESEETRMREEVFTLQETLTGNTSELASLCAIGNYTADNIEGSSESDSPCCVPQKSIREILAYIEASVILKLANLSENNGTCVHLEHLPMVVLSLDEINNIVDVVSLAIDRGLDPRSTPENNAPPRWSFWGAIQFSVTLLTTIGYGSMAPVTPGGRVFCVLYGLLGIPLTAVLLGKIAHGLGGVAIRLTHKIHQFKPSWNNETVGLVVTTGLVVLGLVVFVLLPALTVSIVEEWVYLDALYFMFVSLSTVGFGDYLIGERRDINYSIVYSLLIVLWILLGLAFLALIFDLISRSIEKVGEDKVENQEMAGSSPEGGADDAEKVGGNCDVETVVGSVESMDSETTSL